MKKVMPIILIDNRQRKKRLNLPEISRISCRILNLLGEKKSELSLTFMADRGITILNRKYLSSSCATDVLAFPMREKKEKNIHTSILGDVVISVERAFHQAKKIGEPFERELIRLIIHGILHLTGYTDDSCSGRIKMFQRQEEILLNIYEAA